MANVDARIELKIVKLKWHLTSFCSQSHKNCSYSCFGRTCSRLSIFMLDPLAFMFILILTEGWTIHSLLPFPFEPVMILYTLALVFLTNIADHPDIS